MVNKIHTKVLIIGHGAAGMSAALHLKTDDVVIIKSNGSNSILSPWNIMVKEKESIKKEMLDAGKRMNDKDLLKIYSERFLEIIDDLKSLGIKFKKSNIGMVPAVSFPGIFIEKNLTKKIKEKKIITFHGKVTNFLIDDKRKIRGVEVCLENNKKLTTTFDFLILAAGGMSGFFQFTTGEKLVNGSILALAYEAGLELVNPEFFMFHPFLITDKRFPNVLISGEILTKMLFRNENKEEFLSEKIINALRGNKHHYVFPEMIKEFYIQSLKGKIFAQIKCSSAWFEKYKKENEFGYIFKNYKIKDVGEIEIHPAFHFSIGGIKINKKAQTSQKHVYAAGEIAGGLHGANRIGGTGVAEGWLFGKIAAEEINKLFKNFKNQRIKNLKRTKKSKLDEKVREETWRALGPIKDKGNLEKFLSYFNRRVTITPEENFIKAILKASLLRKESIGVFTRKDLPIKNRAKNSFIKNNKISFR